jgi:hypothetical protein
MDTGEYHTYCIEANKEFSLNSTEKAFFTSRENHRRTPGWYFQTNPYCEIDPLKRKKQNYVMQRPEKRKATIPFPCGLKMF